MRFSRSILTFVIGIGCVAVTSEIVSQQPQKHTDWSVSIAETRMKTMTAEQQIAYVSSLQQEQLATFCEKFPCAPGCGRTFCECFPGAPWCSLDDKQTGTSAEWSVSIAKTRMKAMTAEQQAAYVRSLQQEQQATFCEKFPCAPGCGRTFCECFPGAPWCSLDDKQTGTSAEWSVSITRTRMKTMTAEQQASYVSSLQQDQPENVLRQMSLCTSLR